MLVLSRRENEEIQIGDAITIKVVLVAGRRVKLAIEAPREVRVLRGELQPLENASPNNASSRCIVHDLEALLAHANG